MKRCLLLAVLLAGCGEEPRVGDRSPSPEEQIRTLEADPKIPAESRERAIAAIRQQQAAAQAAVQGHAAVQGKTR